MKSERSHESMGRSNAEGSEDVLGLVYDENEMASLQGACMRWVFREVLKISLACRIESLLSKITKHDSHFNLPDMFCASAWFPAFT